MFPRWNSFESRNMEKMLLLFADTGKAHAAAGDIGELEKYFDFAKRAGSRLTGYSCTAGTFSTMRSFQSTRTMELKLIQRRMHL